MTTAKKRQAPADENPRGFSDGEELGDVFLEEDVQAEVDLSFDVPVDVDEPVVDQQAFPTSYFGYSGTCRTGTVVVPTMDQLRERGVYNPEQLWYTGTGLEGTEVPVVIVTYTDHNSVEHTAYIYDGDGTGSERYIRDGGDSRVGTCEIKGVPTP